MNQPIQINVPPPGPYPEIPIGQQQDQIVVPPPGPPPGPPPQMGPQGNIVINWNPPPVDAPPQEALSEEPGESEESEESEESGEPGESEESEEPEEPEEPGEPEESGESGEPTIGIEGEDIKEYQNTPQIKYLDDDILSKNLNLYQDSETPPILENNGASGGIVRVNDGASGGIIYNISFCIYNIHTDCFIEGLEEDGDSIQFHDTHYLYNQNQPFLQFVLEKKESSYEFPSIQYECPRFSEKNDDSLDEKSQEQIHFESFCFQTISTFLNYTADDETESNINLPKYKNNMDIFHKDKIDIQGIYKGFIQKPTAIASPTSSSDLIQSITPSLLNESRKTENITVVFDFTRLIHLLKPQYTLAIIHEIIYKKTVLSFPVNPSVTNFFETNEFMIPLYYVIKGEDESDGEEIEVLYPFQLYLCHYQDGEYINVKKDEVLDYLPIEHDVFSEIYAFTTEPILDIEGENDSYKRFSCFLVKEKYVIKDVTELTDEEKESEKGELYKASTIYYHENGLQLWGLKNISHFIEY